VEELPSPLPPPQALKVQANVMAGKIFNKVGFMMY
jgi:hypothetical protein